MVYNTRIDFERSEQNMLFTHFESSTSESGRGTAPSLMASNHTRGSRLGTRTKGFISLFDTPFCCVSSKLPTAAPWLSSVATPVADRTLPPCRPACADRTSPVLRRPNPSAAPEPPAPLMGAERKESAVGARESRPAATANTVDTLRDSDPPFRLRCAFRSMLANTSRGGGPS